MKKVLTILCLCVIAIGVIGIELTSAQKEAVIPEARQFLPKEIKLDRNHDGVIDRIEVYNEKGIIIRVEADTTNNGKMDEWVTYKKGKPVKAEKDTNRDGKANMFLTYEKGIVVKSKADTNGDGKINEWVTYKNGKPVKAEKDTSGDGKIDTWIDY